MKKKKTPEIIKQELLTSILEIFKEQDYLKINEEVENLKYEDLLKGAKKKFI